MSKDTRERLEKHFIQDLENLSTYLDRDFDHWLQYHNT